ncbi:MAG: hypothetical protein NVS9B10_08990 [Nevskia sp.]
MPSPPAPESAPASGTAAPGLRARLRGWWRTAGKTANLAIGVGDYEAYCAHQHARHPDQPVMSYAEFFRARQDARYGKGTSRCC